MKNVFEIQYSNSSWMLRDQLNIQLLPLKQIQNLASSFGIDRLQLLLFGRGSKELAGTHPQSGYKAQETLLETLLEALC